MASFIVSTVEGEPPFQVLLGNFYFSATGGENVQLIDKTGEIAITKRLVLTP
jgi:hypothetical protein